MHLSRDLNSRYYVPDTSRCCHCLRPYRYTVLFQQFLQGTIRRLVGLRSSCCYKFLWLNGRRCHFPSAAMNVANASLSPASPALMEAAISGCRCSHRLTSPISICWSRLKESMLARSCKISCFLCAISHVNDPMHSHRISTHKMQQDAYQ